MMLQTSSFNRSEMYRILQRSGGYERHGIILVNIFVILS